MIKYVCVSLLLFNVGWSCGNFQNGPIHSLNIEFDGAKEGYYKKYNLWTKVTDSLLISRIVNAADTSKALWICPPIKPVMWEIDVFVKYNGGEERHFFKIGSNTFGKLSLQKGVRCYDNKPLIEMLMNIVKVEEIRKYPGPMNQDDYDRIKNQE